MRSYNRINSAERRVIQKMLYQHISTNQIAETLGRHCSSIIREISRNSTHGYNARDADELSAKRMPKKKTVIDHTGFLRLIITTLLMENHSPESISAYFLPALFPDDKSMRVSHETIYRWIYQPINRRLVIYLFTRRKSRQNRTKINKSRGIDPLKKSIHQRMSAANDKTEFGHLEGDLIVSVGNDSYALTLVDRKGKYTWGLPLPGKDSHLVLRGIIEALEDLPAGFVKSVTFDNGSEFARYADMEKALGCQVFFADPYCAWQRGLNEHINSRIRQYLPKNKSFRGLTDDRFSEILHIINSRPRKSLGWKSACDVVASIALKT